LLLLEPPLHAPIVLATREAAALARSGGGGERERWMRSGAGGGRDERGGSGGRRRRVDWGTAGQGAVAEARERGWVGDRVRA